LVIEVDESTVTLAGVVGLVRPEGDREKGPRPLTSDVLDRTIDLAHRSA
jgi:hypothetical protein